MATKHPEVFSALAHPFESGQVRTRTQAGRQLSYITARVAMNRLDEVLGPENWRDEYAETESGLKCRIWFRIPGEAEWLWKEDGGASAGMNEADNDEKSAYSDAFKRAAVKLGVGRYLYRDGVADHGQGDASIGHVAEGRPASPDGPSELERSRPSNGNGNLPTTGKALFAWVKEQSGRHDYDLLKHLNHWGRLNSFPAMITNWDEAQVSKAIEEARRRLGVERAQRKLSSAS